MARYKLGKVLLLSNDERTTEQISRVLTTSGVKKLIHCATLEQALTEIQGSVEFQMVIVDSPPPHEIAHSLTKHLHGHAQEQVRLVQVVALCEVLSRADFKEIKDLGFDQIILKPLNDSLLEHSINEIALRMAATPNNIDSLELISEAIQQSSAKEIEKLLQVSLKKRPESIELLSLYAQYLMSQGNLRKADSIISQALEVDELFLPALQLAAKIFLKTGQTQRALKLGDNLQKLNNETSDSAVQYREKSMQFSARFKTGQNLAAMLNNQGLIFAKSKDYERASAFYKFALNADQSKEQRHLVLYNLSILHGRTGNHVEALVVAKQMQSEAPSQFGEGAQLLKRLSAQKPVVSKNPATSIIAKNPARASPSSALELLSELNTSLLESTDMATATTTQESAHESTIAKLNLSENVSAKNRSPSLPATDDWIASALDSSSLQEEASHELLPPLDAPNANISEAQIDVSIQQKKLKDRLAFIMFED